MPWVDAALDLALDIGGVDRPADVLRRRIAQHRDVAGFRVHLDVADMGGEARPRALGVQLTPRRRSGRRCAPP